MTIEVCPICHGSGQELIPPHFPHRLCPACGGRGQTRQQLLAECGAKKTQGPEGPREVVGSTES